MRFNNNLFLLASFLGAATAFRRTCRPATAKDGTGFYTMTKSDQWDTIAADFCVSVEELAGMNPRDFGKPGDVFKVPCKVRKRDCARIANSAYGYYTVANGDNLQAIGNDFCSDVDTIKWLNPDIKSDSVAPGKVVKVFCNWN
ncbi:uncharacterized protein L3040_000079 [Drepanopeziza brunnea f. sp. 'multigermtubi']|uniref:LysM domain-containing protein n=2 Tax=Drepanopeziza brunnea f. sp. 'multigermtubi' TaxID=698441 RepID=K1WNN0_MARBU|nr:uncharacterized protein MBM_07277 [Drepanopeziza brunnea f. sp. 'multigermtubi' MB_m1]AFS30722.1 LysM04p [Drepanopeziza brunnea f. sp. 'multigermtubi']EKD14556.1 hypothetical protein MBM_07277 [Drepanopeziza brunnea f. sp. 'multigermtubi' MB_m1]KAJ5053788.1 hypothetical protein L3040_000079 [Drepanopeziza brunnea f. sp. 'multigermtubi']